MAGGYEKATTIEKAIHKIVNRRCLLPAIHRKFTRSSSQICVLFDSIMRGYPINTCMFWEVREPEVKKSFRFDQIPGTVLRALRRKQSGLRYQGAW